MAAQRADRENHMFESVRARLTVWYSVVLGIVLVLLAVFSYLIYQRNITQRTATNLTELANAFATTFETELPEHAGEDQVKEAARESMMEHRFRDTIFVVTDADGKVLISSLELPTVGPSRLHATSEIFATREFQEVLARADSTARTLLES